MTTLHSDKFAARAREFMPGGVNSPVRACCGMGRAPLFIDHAVGSRIVDVDGNSYLDFVGSWGPNILGAADPDVVRAVQEACAKGLSFGACHAGEIELAERIRCAMPSMEMMRLVNSGTEAVMSAVRVARGFTRRNKIVKFEGCYHGHSDGLLVKSGSGTLTHAIPDSAGVPSAIARETLVATYNDCASVEKLFDEYGADIACVIVEPCAANMGVVPPVPGFLDFLREITRRQNALLIFDEVITGFRLSFGGAQEYYGVIPDLTVLGKIVGGGLPLAVYGGRREVMSCVAPLGAVYQAGTLSGNPLAVAAGNTTLAKLKALGPSAYHTLAQKGTRLAVALRTAGLSVNCEGSLLTPFFTTRTVRTFADVATCDRAAHARFWNTLLDHGIYTAPSPFEALFVSFAHSDADITQACDTLTGISILSR